MNRPMLFFSGALLILLLLGQMAFADERSPIYRISTGVDAGYGIDKSMLGEMLIDMLAPQSVSNVGVDYTVNSGPAVEIPLIFRGTLGSNIYFIASPAIHFSMNTAEGSAVMTTGSGVVYADIADTISVMGARIGAGAGVEISDKLHLEIMNFAGINSVSRNYEITFSGDAENKVSGTNQGTGYGYGINLGVYYSFPNDSHLGFRVGYLGSSVKLRDVTYKQNGAAFAVEFGY